MSLADKVNKRQRMLQEMGVKVEEIRQGVSMADKDTSERLMLQDTRSVAGKGSEMLGERQTRGEGAWQTRGTGDNQSGRKAEWKAI